MDSAGKPFIVLIIIMAVMCGTAFADSPQVFNLSGDPAALVQQYLTVKKADKLKGIKKVVIPQFMVQFYTMNSGAATASNAKNSTTVSVSYTLKNVEQAQMQAIADKMYDQVVAEFKQAGIEVIPVEEYKQDKPFQKLLADAKKAPFEVSKNDTTSYFFGAKGLPVYFEMNDKRLPIGGMFAAQFSNFNPEKWEEKIGEDKDAAVLIVNYAVTFAFMETKGGFWGKSASVNTQLQVTLIPEDTKYIIHSKNGTTRFTLKEAVYADGKFITDITDALRTDEKAANAIGSLLGSFTGTKSSTKKNNANADAAAYTLLVEKHILAINSLIFSQMKANF